MSPARLSLAALAATLLALLVVGLTELGGSPRSTVSSKLTLAQMKLALRGSPPALAAVHAQAGQLLAGGLATVRGRLASLRGKPIVLNKWASWCAPCRAEFAAFQLASLHDGRQVAFLGLDSGDTSRGDARSFLSRHPVSYPSYYDASGAAGLAITDSTFTPVTVFFDRHGSRYIHQGPYPSAARLEEDVRRYALDG